MAVLNINWGSTTRVSPTEAVAVTPREGEEEVPVSDAVVERASKPILIYVTEGVESGGFDKVEKVILGDDKVAVGTKAFRCVKMTPDAVAKDPLLAGKGKEVPRFLFVSVDYKDVDVVEGTKLSVSGTYNAMKKAARGAYSTNFDKNVRELVKLLNEFDKINNERSLLNAKADRTKDPSAADQRKLAKDREELDAREKQANEKKESLLSFELRQV